MKKFLFLFLLIFLLYGCRGGSSSESYNFSIQQNGYSYEDLIENFSPSSDRDFSGSLTDSGHLNPEPATALLFGVSLLGWAGYNLRKRKNVFKKR